VQFEVDLSAPLPGGGGRRREEGSPDEEEMDRESLLRQLNVDSMGLGWEDETESDQEDSPFHRLASSMVDLSGDGGVLKKMLHVGIGEDVPERALVRVHYNGYLEYSDEPYDSSRLRGKQQQFVLGNGEVIPGLEVAVKSMKRNERSHFLVCSEYAFGKLGCPPRIPPNATILFEVELLGFVEYHGAEGEGEGRSLSFEQRLAAANSEREVGNDYFQQNMIGRAVGRYLKAVRQLEAVRLRDENQEVVWRTSLKKLYRSWPSATVDVSSNWMGRT
jgi:FK506-binding protein 6